MNDLVIIGLLAGLLFVNLARWIQDDWYRWQSAWLRLRRKLTRR